MDGTRRDRTRTLGFAGPHAPRYTSAPSLTYNFNYNTNTEHTEHTNDSSCGGGLRRINIHHPFPIIISQRKAVAVVGHWATAMVSVGGAAVVSPSTRRRTSRSSTGRGFRGRWPGR